MIRAVLTATIIAIAIPAHADEYFTGHARVIDGDTIDIGFQVIRLVGIDAPEEDQRCRDLAGKEWDCSGAATKKLIDLIGGRQVTCGVKTYDRYERALGLCKVVGENTTLNGDLVRNGVALAFRRYSDRFIPEEDAARAEKIGMWAGEFEAPWDWRKHKREASR